MKKYLPILLILSLVKFIIHLVGNRNYGYQRDELLHMSVGQHPDWGYMEFPPLIGWIAGLSQFLFADSLSGLRLFSTLAGIGMLILCCMTAKELGGKKHAVLIAGICVLTFLPFYRNHTLFQPVAFEQFLWTLGFYFVIQFMNSQNKNYLLLLGITAGLGLMNKYTFLIWGVGISIGFLFYDKGKVYKSKWSYIAAALAFLIFLPNIIWQYQHHFPILLHLKELKESQLDEIGPYDFLLDQLEYVFTFIVSIIGLVALLFFTPLKKYRSLAISVLLIFGLMWITDSKSYYFFAAYPVMFAAGAVAIEKLLQKWPAWNYAVVAALLITMPFIPHAAPILPVDDYVAYANLKPDANGHIELPDDYADMFGWEEQVKLVDSIYKSLSESERQNCILLASNYGEAGALKIIGKRYNLPNPVCANGSFWLWGTGKTSGNVCISIGVDQKSIETVYAESQLVKVIHHKFAIEEENGISVFLCRRPKVNMKAMWPTLEKQVFK